MNKKAQVLALFITVIPVIFVVVMFVYESSVFVNKKSNTENILESTMMDAKKYNLSDDEIINLLKENICTWIQTQILTFTILINAHLEKL